MTLRALELLLHRHDAKLESVQTWEQYESAVKQFLHLPKEALRKNAWESYPSDAVIPSWPELSETGCFACHHNLVSPSWRQSRSLRGRQPGSFPWQTWLTPLVPEASSLVDPASGLSQNELLDSDTVRTLLETLKTRMSSLRAMRADEDRETVVEIVQSLRPHLDNAGRMLASGVASDSLSIQLNEASVDELMRQVAGRGIVLSGESWDAATQTYLALCAIQQARRDLHGRLAEPSENDKEIERRLNSIRMYLEFPDGSESPRHVDDGDHVEAVRKELRAILKALKAN